MDDNIETMWWFTGGECGAEKHPLGDFIDFKLCTFYAKIFISNSKGTMNGVQMICKAAHKLSGCSYIWWDDFKLTRRHFLSTQYLVFPSDVCIFFHWTFSLNKRIIPFMWVCSYNWIELNGFESNNALKILQVFDILYSFNVLSVVMPANEALYNGEIEFIIKIDLRIQFVCLR